MSDDVVFKSEGLLMARKRLENGSDFKPLTMAELHQIESGLEGDRHEFRNKALLNLCIWSGLRISEICGLKISDVYDTKSIRAHLEIKTFGRVECGTRRVILSKQTVRFLLPYVHRRLESGALPDSPLFFASRTPEKNITPNVAWSIVRNSLEKANISNLSVTSLRRTFAKSMLDRGADIQRVQRQMGYKSLTVTGMSLEKALKKK